MGNILPMFKLPGSEPVTCQCRSWLLGSLDSGRPIGLITASMTSAFPFSMTSAFPFSDCGHVSHSLITKTNFTKKALSHPIISPSLNDP